MQQHKPHAPGYDEDYFAWTQHQAKLLRTLEELRPERPVGLDLAHLAEEIEGLGSADLNTVKSLIRLVMVHLIKAASDPRARALRHWRSEATAFAADIPDRYTASMRQLINMQALWKRALKLAELSLQEHGSSVPSIVPGRCPLSIGDVTSEEFDFDAAVKLLTAPQQN